MKHDMLRRDAEFGQFSNISNIQKPHIRQRFLPLQSSEITTQLNKINKFHLKAGNGGDGEPHQ